jgi:arabinose-5-phosphate isomerase
MSHGTLRRVLLDEAEAIRAAADGLTEQFEQAVEWILTCRGRIITCGVGKSGHIARKTSGTLSSTGTPSLFLHAAEAVHGDLGMVQPLDIVLMFSHSGETDELVRLFPALKLQGARSILITGRPDSSAGRQADLILNTRVTKEACPFNLAPTTSTTVMLAVADALAVAAMERRGFGKEHFARFHPSGTLGKRLLLRVEDVMRKGSDLALVRPGTPFLEVIKAITNAHAGAACVCEDGDRLVGFISDGDLRRHMLMGAAALDSTAKDVMKEKVTTIEPTLLAIEALEVFQNFPAKIGEMPVVTEDRQVVGMIMLKDLLRAGIV